MSHAARRSFSISLGFIDSSYRRLLINDLWNDLSKLRWSRSSFKTSLHSRILWRFTFNSRSKHDSIARHFNSRIHPVSLSIRSVLVGNCWICLKLKDFKTKRNLNKLLKSFLNSPETKATQRTAKNIILNILNTEIKFVNCSLFYSLGSFTETQQFLGTLIGFGSMCHSLNNKKQTIFAFESLKNAFKVWVLSVLVSLASALVPFSWRQQHSQDKNLSVSCSVS